MTHAVTSESGVIAKAYQYIIDSGYPWCASRYHSVSIYNETVLVGIHLGGIPQIYDFA